jgi:hypothetical protein
MPLHRTAALKAQTVSSIGFSGAGFLLCYHLGVAKCLLEQGLLPKKGELRSTELRLTGVSGGALVAAAVCAGVDPDDALQMTLSVSRETRKAGMLDALQPGFSLIDVMENRFSTLIHEAVDHDSDFLMRRIDHGRLLRIGLTDRRVFPPIGQNPRAIVHVDRYRDMQDVIASCILSSYIPGVTGPAWGSLDSRHGAILKAGERLRDMIDAGCVLYTSSGVPLPRLSKDHDSVREICWDGGLVNGFPFFDDDTLMVCPLAADFHTNPTINPGIEYDWNTVRHVQIDPRVRLHLTTANMALLRRIIFSSDDEVLESNFIEGYDHAYLFLRRNSLLTVFH